METRKGKNLMKTPDPREVPKWIIRYECPNCALKGKDEDGDFACGKALGALPFRAGHKKGVLVTATCKLKISVN